MMTKLLRYKLRRPPTLFLVGTFLGIISYALVVPKEGGRTCDDSIKTRSVLVELGHQPSQPYQQPRIKNIKASKKLFQKLDPINSKTYFMPCGKVCHPAQRAWRSLGWRKVDDPAHARVIWTNYTLDWAHDNVASWQRYNHLPEGDSFSKRHHLSAGFKRYQEIHGKLPYFVPEFYRLYNSKERLSFERMLTQKGMGGPWNSRNDFKLNLDDEDEKVFRKHFTLLFPVLTLKTRMEIDRIRRENSPRDMISFQRYVCDQLVWNGMHFVVRVFWMVASLDPLLVLYQDGYARIGYNETRPSYIKRDDEAVEFDLFEDFILRHWKQTRALRRQMDDPVTHVKNQFKQSLAILADTFRTAFAKPSRAEDGFEIFAADFVVDKDLDVWLVDTYSSTTSFGGSYDFTMEDHYFLLRKNHQLYYGAILTLQEIWDKQARGVSIVPLQNTGMWQLIVAGDHWMFSYERYSRGRKKTNCKVWRNRKLRKRIVVREGEMEDEDEEGPESISIQLLSGYLDGLVSLSVEDSMKTDSTTLKEDYISQDGADENSDEEPVLPQQSQLSDEEVAGP